jgi:hypothetical protein
MHHNLLLIDIRHYVGLNRCGWCPKLKHLKLLLKGGNCRCPRLELKVLLLHSMLKVYDRVGESVHLLEGEV